MNRRSFVASVAALFPLRWFWGTKGEAVHERPLTPERCPWCGNLCMIFDNDPDFAIRITADCEEHFEAYLKPEHNGDRSYEELERLCKSYGNNYGRTKWCSTLEEAIADWNNKVRRGRKTNQLGVW